MRCADFVNVSLVRKILSRTLFLVLPRLALVFSSFLHMRAFLNVTSLLCLSDVIKEKQIFRRLRGSSRHSISLSYCRPNVLDLVYGISMSKTNRSIMYPVRPQMT